MGRPNQLDMSNLIDSNVDLFMYLIEGITGWVHERSTFELGLFKLAVCFSTVFFLTDEFLFLLKFHRWRDGALFCLVGS